MGVFNAFFFGEVTSRDYNLVIESKSILNAPEPDLQEYEIPGREGTVFISNNRRRNVDRITPAHAGKRAFLARICLREGDHPRTRGEKTSIFVLL